MKPTLKSNLKSTLVPILGFAVLVAVAGNGLAQDYGRASRMTTQFQPPAFQPQPPQFNQQRRLRDDTVWIDCQAILGFTGVLVPQGVLIHSVIPGSEACRIGLNAGDTIIRVEGYRIGCLQDWEAALASGRGVPTFHVKRVGRARVDRIVATLQRGCPLPGIHVPGHYGAEPEFLPPLPPRSGFPSEVRPPVGRTGQIEPWNRNGVQFRISLGN